MPQRNLPLLKCDLCDFSSKNHYIFSKHHKRCQRVHRTSAQRKEKLQTFAAAKKIGDEEADDKNGEESCVREYKEGDFPTSATVQKQMDGKSSPVPTGKTTRASTAPRPESTGELQTKLRPRVVSASETLQGEEDEDETTGEEDMEELAIESEEQTSTSSTAADLPPPNVSRNYRCGQCGYATTKSKMFLYHQIDQHKARISIFPCNFCEYASRFKHKLVRHIIYAHKKKVPMDDMTAENQKPGDREAGTKKSASALKLIKNKKTGGSILKKKPLSALLGKLKGKDKIPDLHLSAFYIDLSAQKQEGSAGAPLSDQFKCKLCLFTGKSKNHVVRHIYACHINGRVFRCNLCSFKTQSQIDFYAHKKKHSTKNATVFKCKECSYATDFKPNFERHMANHGTNKPHKCSLCSYATDHEGALKRHVTSHHPNTAHNTSLVAGDTVVEGVIPDTGETVDANLGQEELESDGFRCPICSLLYRRCADLNRHMKSKHNIRRKDFFDDSGQEDDDGGKSDKGEMAEELEMDLDEEEEDDEESRPLADLVPKHKNQQQSKKNLKCSYCSYIAKWPSDLRRHLLVHSVEKRYKCSLCCKKYKYLGDLNVHLRRDHEVDPDGEDVIREKVTTIPIKKNSPSLFRCPSCPFVTRFKSEMDRHRHIHTEEKCYRCRMCDYQTYWRGDMGRHLYRRHADQVSKDADINDYFDFDPERKAFRKTKAGRESRSKTPEMEKSLAAAHSAPEREPDLAPEPGTSVSDRVLEAVSPSDSLSVNSTETRDKYGNKMWKCKHCSYTANAASKMRPHLDTHYNLKQFKCPVCGQRANWKYDIRKHMAVKHPACGEDVICLSFEEAKATIDEYMSTMPHVRRDHHLNSGEGMAVIDRCAQKPYKCSECSFRSDYRWSVSKHQRNVHSGQENISIVVLKKGSKDAEVEEGKTPEKKEKQGLSPLKREKRQIVLAAERKARETTQEEVEEDEDKSGHSFQCATCGKTGSSKGSIKKHYNYIHPTHEVIIVNLADGSKFNYYTGLPMEPSGQSAPPKPITPPSEKDLKSVLNDPKKHGYVKPFQCSVCGQRSNWKWDVKKHLRSKHPDQFGYVIVLQIDQARATFPGHQYRAVTPADVASVASSASSSTAGASHMGRDERDVSPSSTDDTCASDMPYKSYEMRMGRYRRYKCSKCGYRSNWRTDIVRHIERLHRNTNARLIFLDVETAKNTFMDYDYKPSIPIINKHRDKPLAPPQAVTKLQLSCTKSLTSKAGGKLRREQPLQGKVWHCPKCVFKSSVKSHILQHMQSHGMKAFHCTQCKFATRFRSPLYRHIRSQHHTTEYSKSAKIVLKFFKPASQVQGRRKAAELGQYVDAYLCRLCNTMESESEEVLLKHLEERHNTRDPNQALRVKKRLGAEDLQTSGSHAADSDAGHGQAAKTSGKLYYFCTVCPFRGHQRSMLTFHHAHHQPSSQNKYKCKYCPYYVCTPRLLSQHVKWHEGGAGQSDSEMETWVSGGEKTPPSSPSKRGRMDACDMTPKKHNCEKCPYTTNSRNDFIYHKQFHRPKPAAEYKCEHCDYWVTHRRLLKQHIRLHGNFYQSVDSTTASPNKSLASDASAVLDAVEIAAIKQKMIAAKITASLSTSPAVSPMKIATQCSAGNRPGFILQNGMYRKLHQCRKCPYTNIRARNLRLHELMHGPRKSEHPLMKCPYCDYYVGSKGLLSHHMKVHLQQYLPDPNESTTFHMEQREEVPGARPLLDQLDDDDKDVFASPDIPQKHKVDTLLEISRFKRYSCEKCPYASAKRSHFMRHMELHGSRQRHTCEYCDYAVPSASLLTQHRKIHVMPNQNLLATQSFSNLQHMQEVPADVALASALPPTDSAEPVTISVIHDHLELYENDDTNSMDLEPKKLYRCDRCPYANVRRDHLLTHLRFHMQRSNFHCPYCDYSVPKQQLLTQHIRVHFCPLPELSDWLIENGQTERAQEVNDVDLARALEIADKYQSSSKRKLHHAQEGEENTPASKKVKPEDAAGDGGAGDGGAGDCGAGDSVKAYSAPEGEKESSSLNTYICQYCDREFATSKQLISHEMQHLIGNHFEFSDDSLGEDGAATEKSQVEKNPKPVDKAAHDSNEDGEVETGTSEDRPADTEKLAGETTEKAALASDCEPAAHVTKSETDVAETSGDVKIISVDSKEPPERGGRDEDKVDDMMDVSVEGEKAAEEEGTEEEVPSRRQLRPRGDFASNNGNNGMESGDDVDDTSKKDVAE